jgi:site-specific DNA-methyltransferase (adenine-specific)
VIVNRILNCEALAGLGALPPASVPLTVTSPKWDDAREYGGHDFDWRAVADELWRVTTPGGVACWQYQDQIIKETGSESCTSAEQKLYFVRELGFRLYQTLTVLTWNYRVFPRRYYRWSSQVFVLSKGKPGVVNLLRDRKNKHAGRRREANMRFPNGVVMKSKQLTIAEYGNRGDVWAYTVGGRRMAEEDYAQEHPALMPEALARDLILSFSAPGGLVLDICAGAGTTCKMALLTGRRYLGFEPWDFAYDLAQRRMDDAHRKLVQE